MMWKMEITTARGAFTLEAKEWDDNPFSCQVEECVKENLLCVTDYEGSWVYVPWREVKDIVIWRMLDEVGELIS